MLAKLMFIVRTGAADVYIILAYITLLFSKVPNPQMVIYGPEMNW